MPLCFCQKLLHVGGDNTVFCQRAHHVDFGLYADVPFVPVGAQVKGGAAVEAIAVASASGVGRGASYLLQVLDDGRLTDNKGRTVNFKNTIIIMTSNMGSGYIQSQMEKLNSSNKEQIVEETKKEVMNMLKKTIRPEFLNRIDETIMFLPLTEPEIKQIVMLQIKSVQKMLSGNGMELVLTNAAIDFLANAGYDPEFGARPVKRAIQHYLLNDLSKKLLSQEVDRSKPITVDANTTDDGLVFRN